MGLGNCVYRGYGLGFLMDVWLCGFFKWKWKDDFV